MPPVDDKNRNRRIAQDVRPMPRGAEEEGQRPDIRGQGQASSLRDRRYRGLHRQPRLIAGSVEVKPIQGVRGIRWNSALFMVKFEKKGVKVSPLFCDKLAIVIQYKTSAERNHVRQGLKYLKYNSHGHYAYDGGKAKYKSGFYLYVELSEMVSKLLIQADPKYYTDHFLRVDYNPAHADPGTVRWLLDQVLPGGWMDIATHSTCTRFDATVDVTGVSVEELLVCYPQMSRSRVICKSGKTETYELGAYQGDKHVVIYEKCAEIKQWNAKHAIKKAVPTCPVAALEIVLRPSIPFDGLIQL